METPEPSVSRSARQFVMMGVQLQEALKTGQSLDASLDAFCREAFARRDLGQSISFLLSLVNKDVARLAELLKPRHLVAELSMGSQILSSLVAAQWDKTEHTDRLAELAEGILNAHRGGTPMEASGEFSAALAKTIAVMHPGRARALLEMCSPWLQGRPEFANILKEAWDWQKAGELLSEKDLEFRRFWHQTLRQQRGDWFWDTAEGRKALAGLDSGNGDLNVRGGIFRRSVPKWAWKPSDPAQNLQANAAASPNAAAAVTDRAPPLPAPAPPVPAATNTRERESTGATWVMIGSLGLLACAALIVGITQIDIGRLLPSAARTTETATVLPARLTKAVATGVEDTPVVASATPAQASAVTTAATARAMADKVTASAPAATLAPSPSMTRPVAAAEPVPVTLTDRKGWVKTPLGSEFQVTASNATAGKVTDREGRVWRLPDDPSLEAVDVKGGRQAVNPYNGETVTVAAEQWQPGQKLSFANSGWTFRLPANLPMEIAAAAPKKEPAVLSNTVQPSIAATTAASPAIAANTAMPTARSANVNSMGSGSKPSEPRSTQNTMESPPVAAVPAPSKAPAVEPAAAPSSPPVPASSPAAAHQPPPVATPTPAPAAPDKEAGPSTMASRAAPQNLPSPVASVEPPAAPVPAKTKAEAANPTDKTGNTVLNEEKTEMPAKAASEATPQPLIAATASASKSSSNSKAKPASKKTTKGKAVTVRRPTSTPPRKESPPATVSEDTRQQLVFVTRANSIRMNYRGGYWESRPGAYLPGAGQNPTDWARDMTLRERSSGTIPEGYVFRVADRGVVRVQPELPRK